MIITLCTEFFYEYSLPRIMRSLIPIKPYGSVPIIFYNFKFQSKNNNNRLSIHIGPRYLVIFTI